MGFDNSWRWDIFCFNPTALDLLFSVTIMCPNDELSWLFKVHVFWEGHNNLQNLCRFCGLLRKHELLPFYTWALFESVLEVKVLSMTTKVTSKSWSWIRSKTIWIDIFWTLRSFNIYPGSAFVYWQKSIINFSLLLTAPLSLFLALCKQCTVVNLKI